MRDYKLYLTDILKAIRKINRYSKGLTYEEFKKSDTMNKAHSLLTFEDVTL